MGVNLPIADKPTLDTVNTNVGSNADASSATGSIHAKLKAIATSIASLATSLSSIVTATQRKYYHGYFTTSSIEYVTALSVTGKGVLTNLAILGVSSAYDSGFQIITDGTLLYTGLFGSTPTILTIVGNYGLYHASLNYPPANVSFDNSLEIKMKKGASGTDPVSLGWEYCK